ncbi:hypothetical protein [Streptomyces sp. 2112.3]|nr:hypothetical protein [Streptomyces sp. 2112.3]
MRTRRGFTQWAQGAQASRCEVITVVAVVHHLDFAATPTPPRR